jgi:cell division topological specificity factor MinE
MWNVKTLFNDKRSRSRDIASGRLQEVLAQDRVGLEGARLQELQHKLVELLAAYLDIDAEAAEVQLENRRGDARITVQGPLRRSAPVAAASP